MALVRSLVFSILASVLATVVVRRVLSTTAPLDDSGHGTPQGAQAVVVVVPVFVGNSNNRIGWVKEEHHHHHGRSPFGRARHHKRR